MPESTPPSVQHDRIDAHAPPTFDRFILRCKPATLPTLAAAIGIDLPTLACRAVVGEDVAALWLGPDEWLLLGPPTQEHRAAQLGRRLDGMRCSLVDVTHRHIAMVVERDDAEDILATGCPLDLALPAFPVGMCTRTLFHKAEIILWRTAQNRFHLEVWRSFAPYVAALLAEAESEG